MPDVARFCVVTLGCVTAVGLALTGTACGASGVIASPDTDPCVVSHHRGESRIKPQNSGLTCATVQTILLVLPDAVGKWWLEASIPSQGRICRVYPPAAYPLEVKCHHGGKHFEVDGISRFE